jgi:protein-tyrosine-phosphatase
MAEAIARHRYSGLIEPSSAGLAPAAIVQPETLRCLEEIGVELPAGQRPEALLRANWRDADLIVNMSGLPVHAVIPEYPGDLAIWKIPDPMGRSPETYRAVRDSIADHIDVLAKQLRHASQNV